MAYTMLGIHYIMPKTFYAYLTFMVSLITIFSIYVAPCMHINAITCMDANTSHVLVCLHC